MIYSGEVSVICKKHTIHFEEEVIEYVELERYSKGDVIGEVLINMKATDACKVVVISETFQAFTLF